MNTFVLFLLAILASIFGCLIAGFIGITLVVGGISTKFTETANTVTDPAVSVPGAVYIRPNGTRVSIA